MPGLPHELGGAKAWLDLWGDATRWWAQPAAGQAEIWGEAGSKLLTELIDGLAGRFEGRRVELVLADRRTSATLDWVRLRRRGDVYQARAELGEIDWDGWRFETLAIRAESVRVSPGARIDVADIEIAGRSSAASLIARLNRELEWQLAFGEDGHVTARHPRGGVSIVVEPVVRRHQLRMELRGLRWHRLRLDMPRWLRLTRTRPLPALAHGLTIEAATAQGDLIDLRLAIPSINQQVEPGRLRDAIARLT